MIHDSCIQVSSIAQPSSSKGKVPIRTPVRLNRSSGKESTATCSFSEQNWGTATRKITATTARWSPDEIASIIELPRTAWDEIYDHDELMNESQEVDKYSLICKLFHYSTSSLTRTHLVIEFFSKALVSLPACFVTVLFHFFAPVHVFPPFLHCPSLPWCS